MERLTKDIKVYSSFFLALCRAILMPVRRAVRSAFSRAVNVPAGRAVNVQVCLAVAALMLTGMRAVAQVPEALVFVQLEYVQDTEHELVIDTVKAGDSGQQSYNAPLKVTFHSELIGPDAGDYTMFPEWTVRRIWNEDGRQNTQVYLKRQTAVTDIEIREYGTFQVSFAYSCRKNGLQDTEMGNEIGMITFNVDASDLKTFNAFSPNGDGINDFYRVYVKSITEFSMSIFNRQGQLIKSGNLNNLPKEDFGNDGGYYLNCWDGYSGGNVVRDGVYFVNIKAVGAGGKVYEIRRDINVLTGLGIE